MLHKIGLQSDNCATDTVTFEYSDNYLSGQTILL